MLGLNFHIFWMRFATDLDIKLFSEKIEKDFLGRVTPPPALGNALQGRVTPPPVPENPVPRHHPPFPGAGGGVTRPWKWKPYIIQWRPRS